MLSSFTHFSTFRTINLFYENQLIFRVNNYSKNIMLFIVIISGWHVINQTLMSIIQEIYSTNCLNNIRVSSIFAVSLRIL